MALEKDIKELKEQHSIAQFCSITKTGCDGCIYEDDCAFVERDTAVKKAIDEAVAITKKAYEEEIECREKELKEYSEKCHKQGNEIARLEEEIEALESKLETVTILKDLQFFELRKYGVYPEDITSGKTELEKRVSRYAEKLEVLKANQKEEATFRNIWDLLNTYQADGMSDVDYCCVVSKNKLAELINQRFGTPKKSIDRDKLESIVNESIADTTGYFEDQDMMIAGIIDAIINYMEDN